MFEFRKIELNDRDRINEKLRISDFRGCEYSFANNMAWQRLNDTQICLYGDFYISCSFDGGQPYITFPAGVKTDDDTGRQKYIRLFEKLKDHFEKQGKRLVVSSVTEENLGWIKEYYKDEITCEYNRDGSDYIYNSSDLISFAGKKYHGKRNHLKHFYENDWSFEPISQDNLDECIRFSAAFYNNAGEADFSAMVEQYAINLFFMNMDSLGLKGGALKADGELVGITIGEQLNSDTFVVHIEKARSDVQGAYPAICNQFVKANAYDLKYINREEDLGLEGLRKSKLSYRPAFLLDKHIIYFK